MKPGIWQSSMAAALLLGTTAAYAQAPQKSEEGRAPSPGAQTPGAQAPKSEGPARRADPEPKGPAGKGNVQAGPESRGESKGPRQAEPKDKGSGQKRSAQGEPAQRPGKGNAQSEPQEKSKGSAQRAPSEQPGKSGQAEPREKAQKGTDRDKTQKGAEKNAPAPSKSTEKQGEPSEKGATAPSSGQRVQLSEQQRTSVHQTLLKERRVNRATNVNVSINVGTRVPRSVRLAPLPAAILVIVPEYRRYRYVVVEDRICIVEPTTYEIVEVITDSGRVAGRDDRGGARLVLTSAERRIVLSEVDMTGDSTLALGSMSEGADVPRNVELRSFPTAVVEQVPKLREYKYFTADDRLAIVGAQGSKVVLVIDARR